MTSETQAPYQASYRPASGKLIVEVVVEDEKSAGGIIIPDVARDEKAKIDRINRGRILAIGPAKCKVTDEGERFIELPWYEVGPNVQAQPKVGDVVVFHRYVGSIDQPGRTGRKLWLLEFDDVWGVIPQEEL